MVGDFRIKYEPESNKSRINRNQYNQLHIQNEKQNTIETNVLAYLQNACRFNQKEKTLLAVSGGVDSVVMCEIFDKLNIAFGIAHCNFQLRGEDSDGDAVFVEELAQKYAVPFFSTNFDTEKTAKEMGISIQMAARQLRYDWLEKMRKKNGFHAIATAHHKNDLVETVLFNLTKGTGIAGLHGIPARNGHIIRPLLCLSREELEEFYQAHKLTHREDASNAATKYSRNKIRHLVVPTLKELNPNLEQTFTENCERFSDTEALYKYAVEQQKKKLFEQRGNDFFIPILKLQRQTIAPKTVLWEALKDWGFTASQVDDIMNALDGPPGKMFYSASHRLLKDRRFLIISEIVSELNQNEPTLFVIDITIEAEDRKILLTDNQKLHIQTSKIDNYSIENNPKVASLDFDKLAFPLKLRHWRAGDYFYPIGLTKKNGKVGKKKLKKYFADQKISIRKKEQMWVLQDNKDRIVWLLGERLDDRFKVDDDTKKVFRMRLKKGK